MRYCYGHIDDLWSRPSCHGLGRKAIVVPTLLFLKLSGVVSGPDFEISFEIRTFVTLYVRWPKKYERLEFSLGVDKMSMSAFQQSDTYLTTLIRPLCLAYLFYLLFS
jgi:hypothetical protein